MKFGVSLLRVNPSRWLEVSTTAEELGFESVWMSDHLVLPTVLRNDVDPARPLPIVPQTPVFDAMVYLAAIANATTTLRLGTYVYQLALRHPFTAARSVATLDVLSAGRVELGVGAGYIAAEWDAAGLDFSTRGARLDETIELCRRLWSEPVVSHSGRHFSFGPVSFEPKPVQRPHPPLHVGGESPAAMSRAIAHGDGWVGMHHSPESAAPVLERLREAARTARRAAPLITTVAAHPGPAVPVDQWRDLGIDRLICAPWTSTRDALDGLRAFATRHIR
jgi:probable F420-dependent oxidoreductase